MPSIQLINKYRDMTVNKLDEDHNNGIYWRLASSQHPGQYWGSYSRTRKVNIILQLKPLKPCVFQNLLYG